MPPIEELQPVSTVAPQDQIVEREVTPQEPGTEPPVEGQESPKPEGQEDPNHVAFPKKAVNKINRQAKEIRRLRNELHSVRTEREKITSETSAAPANPEPTEDNFETYGDFLKARQDWLHAQGKNETAAQQRETTLNSQEQAIREQQENIIAESINELAQAHPEIKQVVESPVYQQLIAAMPDHIEKLMYELDDPFAASLALVADGTIQDVYRLSPTMAAARLLDAEQRGRAALSRLGSGGAVPTPATPGTAPQPATTSQAPKPMAAAKGAGSVSKPLEEMSPSELRAWARS